MVATRHNVLLLGVALVAGACMDPVEPDIDYEVELAVAGGITATDYAFEIDGATGEVRGVTCVAGCDFQPDELLAELPLSKRMALASEFDRADFLDLTQTEYGVVCCDAFEYTLTYRKDGRELTVHGTSDTLPAELDALVGAVREVLPAQ